jgi:DNA-directed RNA polymerase subunit M/transcription elongation factor TFIIS
VPEHYAFTDNVRDLSNQDGYQFEFECERCGNGYRSPFVHDKIAFGSKMLRAAGDLIGGNGYKLSQAAYHLDRATNSKAKDRAFSSAVETVSGEFKQCRGCGDWMCHQVCWNDEIGQCLRCSPVVAEEIARAQAAAQVQQIRDKAETVDWTRGLDISHRAVVTCPSCAAKVDGGRFCSACGTSLAQVVVCPGCEYTKNAEGAAFCSQCAHALR